MWWVFTRTWITWDWCLDTMLRRLIEFHYTCWHACSYISSIYLPNVPYLNCRHVWRLYLCLFWSIGKVCGVNHATVFVFLNCELSRVMHELCFTLQDPPCWQCREQWVCCCLPGLPWQQALHNRCCQWVRIKIIAIAVTQEIQCCV